MAIVDPISECDKIDSILQGLPEEYNPFIMIVYGKTDPMDIYEVEGLMHVQEAQLGKYHQEIVVPNALSNFFQAGINTQATKPANSRGSSHY